MQGKKGTIYSDIQKKKRKYLNFERIKNTMIKVEQRGNIAENMTYQPSTCNYFGKG